MKLRTVLAFNSIAALAISIGFILLPSNVIFLYGGSTDVVGLFLARHYGATALGIAVLTWLARGLSTEDVRQAILPALLSVFLIEFVIDLLAQLSGLLNALGWSVVVLDLLFALAYGYFLFVKPVAAGAK